MLSPTLAAARIQRTTKYLWSCRCNCSRGRIARKASASRRCFSQTTFPLQAQASRTRPIPATNLALMNWGVEESSSRQQPLQMTPEKTSFPSLSTLLSSSTADPHGDSKSQTNTRQQQQQQQQQQSFSSLAEASTHEEEEESPTSMLKQYHNNNNNSHRNDTLAAVGPPDGDLNNKNDDDSASSLFANITPSQLQELASHRPTPLRLTDMYKYGSSKHDLPQRLRNAQFLYKELPIRVAQRAVDLLSLPYGLASVPPIRQVAAIYTNYVVALQQAEFPTTPTTEQAFTQVLQQVVLDRASVPTMIARGVAVWRQQQAELQQQQQQDASSTEGKSSATEAQDDVLEQALYRFFTARVGLRFLTEHHVLSSSSPLPLASSSPLTNNNSNPTLPNNNHQGIGCIQPNVNVAAQAQQVADLLKQQICDYYGGSSKKKNFSCPDIQIVDCNPSQVDFTYAPHHLQYMLMELLKNSIRATLRHFALHTHQTGRNAVAPPPIKVIIAKGAEDVTIKIADRGGGIRRSHWAKIWKFAHSTKAPHELEHEFGQDAEGARIRGFGLPLARIYARYFGGELTLKSTEGHGVDAYLYLPRLGDACENMPLRVQASPGGLDSMPAAATTTNPHRTSSLGSANSTR